MHRIEVCQFTGKNAITAKQGQPIFDIVFPLLHLGHKVAIDFLSVRIIASQFLSASIGQFLREFDKDVLRERLDIANLPPYTSETLLRVLENSEKYYAGETRKLGIEE